MATFVNAQEMHRQHPETYDVPAPQWLRAISPGDHVKICAAPERFWARVTARDGHEITARVNNQLVYTDRHGLRFGDVVHVTTDNILDIEFERGAPPTEEEMAAQQAAVDQQEAQDAEKFTQMLGGPLPEEDNDIIFWIAEDLDHMVEAYRKIAQRHFKGKVQIGHIITALHLVADDLDVGLGEGGETEDAQGRSE